jgi:hypothetical protein
MMRIIVTIISWISILVGLGSSLFTWAVALVYHDIFPEGWTSIGLGSAAMLLGLLALHIQEKTP